MLPARERLALTKFERSGSVNKVTTQGGNVTPAEVKKRALREVWQGKKSKTEIAQGAGVTRKTLYEWIAEERKGIQALTPAQKLSLWESKSISDAELSHLAFTLLKEELQSNPSSISTSEKRAIAYAAAMSSGLAWDKAHPRTEAPVSINIDLRQAISDAMERVTNLKRELDGEIPETEPATEPQAE